MGGTALDTAAWSSRWRHRAVQDKALLVGLLIAAAAWLPMWPGSILVLTLVTVLAVGPARTRWRVWLTCLSVPAVFIGTGALAVALVVTRDPVLSIGVTSESMRRAAEVAGHSLAGTSAMMLLAVTTPMVDVLAGLRRLRLPDACVDVASLTYRILFLLLETTLEIRTAQEGRLGYTSVRRGVRSAGLLTSTVLIRSWDRARRLDEGLAGRGYSSSLRTLDDAPAGSSRFRVAACAAVAIIVAVAVLTA